MGRKHILKRIGEAIEVDKATGCWHWTKAFNSAGQPVIGHWEEYDPEIVTRKVAQVRRVIYAAYNGIIPSGVRVRMSCENKKCVNPKHMALQDSSDSIKLSDLGLKQSIPRDVQPKDSRQYLEDDGTWE